MLYGRITPRLCISPAAGLTGRGLARRLVSSEKTLEAQELLAQETRSLPVVGQNLVHGGEMVVGNLVQQVMQVRTRHVVKVRHGIPLWIPFTGPQLSTRYRAVAVSRRS